MRSVLIVGGGPGVDRLAPGRYRSFDLVSMINHRHSPKLWAVQFFLSAYGDQVHYGEQTIRELLEYLRAPGDSHHVNVSHATVDHVVRAFDRVAIAKAMHLDDLLVEQQHRLYEAVSRMSVDEFLRSYPDIPARLSQDLDDLLIAELRRCRVGALQAQARIDRGVLPAEDAPESWYSINGLIFTSFERHRELLEMSNVSHIEPGGSWPWLRTHYGMHREEDGEAFERLVNTLGDPLEPFAEKRNRLDSGKTAAMAAVLAPDVFLLRHGKTPRIFEREPLEITLAGFEARDPYSDRFFDELGIVAKERNEGIRLQPVCV